MKYEQARDRLITQANLRDRHITADVLRLGELATAAILARTGKYPPRGRSLERARTLTDLRNALGNTNDANELTRWVHCYGTAQAFGLKEAKQLPLATIRVLAPLVKRNTRNETWAVKAKYLDFARELWARCPTSTAAAIGQDVQRHLHGDRQPTKKKTPHPAYTLDAVRSSLMKLTRDEQQQLLDLLTAHLRPTPATTATVAMQPPPTAKRLHPLDFLTGRRAG